MPATHPAFFLRANSLPFDFRFVLLSSYCNRLFLKQFGEPDAMEREGRQGRPLDRSSATNWRLCRQEAAAT